VSAEATTQAKPQAGIDLAAQTKPAAEATAKAGTRAELTHARPESAPLGATTSPEARSHITPPVVGPSPTRARLAPTRAEATPARSETGTKLAGAWSKSTPTGLPAEPAAAVQSGVDSSDQSATQVAHDRAAKAEVGAGAVDNRANRVTHQGARVLGNRAHKAGPIPVARVVPPVALLVAAIALLVASVPRVIAVLVGQHLLQPTDRVAYTKRQTG
jgi:hypothetical protein